MPTENRFFGDKSIEKNRFFCPWCTHGSKRVNDYIIEFFKLAERNQLSESKNQPKALQVEGRNFLTIVHNPSSLREVHMMVVKVDVESRDLVGAQILVEVQTLLEEFNDVILEDLPVKLPLIRNMQHHIYI